ncbi:HPP family protein [Desulfosediminicola flagellatus]|uniref:CBS domain-containing protein n=1 Tax=Desulfosediminicola flagellatus TaxID=2569541 RepID=UPI0010ACD1E1|nr:CBS domain-containing protein [Desulfosediminicola flagellatus]
MKVRDIMEPINNWLTPEMSVLQAIQVMKRTKRGHGLSVNGIAVLNNEMKIVGIVSTKDILRLLIPSYMYLEGLPEDETGWESMRIERTEKVNKLSVSDIMTEDVRVISLNESIMRCADIMLVEQIRRLPVVGIDGRVLGIIYLRDVYNAITNLLCDTSAIVQAA